MADTYTPKHGDRVRVVMEGIVTTKGLDDDEGDFGIGDGFEMNFIHPVAPHVVEVTKLNDEAKQYGPGDVVYRRDFPAAQYALAADGWVGVGDYWKQPGVRMEVVKGDITQFTDDKFGLVTIK